MQTTKEERLDKHIASTGTASRRKAAELVNSGRVKVNGLVADKPGLRVCPDSTITLDNKPLPPVPARKVTLALNKPRGYICSASSAQGKTVYDFIPDLKQRIVPAGRLDKDSEGLLILSSDGDLINELTHPRYEHKKIYRVTVSGAVTEETITDLRSITEVDGQPISSVHVKRIKAGSRKGRHILEFTLGEGRKRQIRKMCSLVGLRIHRLVRTRIGRLRLKQLGLTTGQWRELTSKEIQQLLQ